MENLNSLTLGQIVASNYKAAAVFEKYDLDFCCNGNRRFDEVCAKAGLDPETITREIHQSNDEAIRADFINWPLDLLTDYICKRHHRYIEQVTPTLNSLIEKICSVHGQNHPELLEIQDIFNTSTGELAAHMKKEELILFPFIRKLVHAKEKGVEVSSPLFESVASPVQKMEEDHQHEGNHLQKIAKLSNDFTPPNDACLMYITTYKMLKEYEQDIHIHIHLENNILFPGALKLEEEVMHT